MAINRRERGDGAPMLDHDVSAQQPEGDFAPPAPQGWQDRLPAQPAEMTDVGSVQRAGAVAPPEPQPAPTAAVPAEAPQRRRSTVREAAPIGGGIELPPTPVPPPQSEPAPVVTSSASDEAKPRKTGWWAKKFLGKD
jgi:ribonuclease E